MTIKLMIKSITGIAVAAVVALSACSSDKGESTATDESAVTSSAAEAEANISDENVSDENGSDEAYTAVTFRSEGDRLIVTGAIDGTTLERFREARKAHPDATVLVLQNIPGSIDDDANLVFSRAVHDAGMTTLVPANGMVASGGTDLFVAGKERILEEGACVGVHSWGDGVEEGDKASRDHPLHQQYLDFYDALQIPQEFYWFTLEAAPASGIHWMTAAETAQYKMTTREVKQLSQGAACDDR